MPVDPISLFGGQIYNLTDPVSGKSGAPIRGTVVGTGEEYETVAAIPNNQRYPGMIIVNKDTNETYMVGDDGETANRLYNVRIQVSDDNSAWFYIENYTGTGFKYIKFELDGVESHAFRVLTVTEMTDLTNHLNNISNPHQVGASQVTSSDGDVQGDIDALQDAVDEKIGKITGHENKFPLFNAAGALAAFTDMVKNTDGDVELAKSLFIAGSANTDPLEITTTDDGNEYGTNGDVELYLKDHDKFHFTVNHNTVIKGFSDAGNIKVGMLFTMILKRSVTGSATVSFEDVPWGSFEDITVNSGDVVMVTGYVLSSTKYLVKKIEF